MQVSGEARIVSRMVPMQMVIKNFFSNIPDFPFQAGSSLSASNIGYITIRQQEALQRLQKVEALMPGR